jgi:glycosyltransferase involved in cell wall biosynthesis
MYKIKVLHIGIKYWPYEDKIIHHKVLKGIRGGGMNKYCDLLIRSFPPSIQSYLIVQQLPIQTKFEEEKNIKIYRTKTFGNRAIRQIIVTLKSFYIAIPIIRKEKIDIIHGHMQPGIFIAYFLGKLLNKPTVATPYSFTTIEMSFIYNKITRFIENHFYKKIDTLVFESDENRKKAFELRGLTFPNSVVINTGINIPEAVNRKPDKKERFNILFLGRLVKVKGLENLVLAFTHLDQDVLNKIHLDIVGEGELFHDLNDLVSMNNLGKWITIHGYVEATSVFFLNSDLFILPSFQEGLSIALLEAMSYGLACIINDYGVPFNDETIYTIRNNSPETIAESIKTLTDNSMLIKTLGEKARTEIVTNYSLAHFSEEYCRVYNNLLVR